MKQKDVARLHEGFINALGINRYYSYMKRLDGDDSRVDECWRECLEIALEDVGATPIDTQRDFDRFYFDEEILLCTIFLLGFEFCLNKLGETLKDQRGNQ